MRRTIFLTMASLSMVLTLPAAHLNAVCAPSPAASSTAGIEAMRAVPFIIYGTIESAVPTDAHAAESYFLKVIGYFRGAGPSRVEVSDYSDGDLPAEAVLPGGSFDAAGQFIDHFRGQDAIVFATRSLSPDSMIEVFATRELVPFVGQFRTTACTYTVYGDAAVADILPLLRRTFGEPTGPHLPQTGPGASAPLFTAGGLLVVAGAAARIGSRRTKSLVPAAPAR